MNNSTELDQIIAAAYENNGELTAANKVYQVFLRSDLFLPIEKQDEKELSSTDEANENFTPLISQYDGKYFLVVFDQYERLVQWAGDDLDKIAYAQLSGRDLVRCVGPQLHICLNVGFDYYKEFCPDEILRLKKVVNKTLPPQERTL